LEASIEARRVGLMEGGEKDRLLYDKGAGEKVLLDWGERKEPSKRWRVFLSQEGGS